MTKPPYRVPTMAEIAAVPPNGYTLVSTFSGAGGSCLGFRMAGFTPLWASEFIGPAAETYRANASPGVILDTRDIRQVQPADVLAAIGGRPIDVLEGSPPCSSFSTAGKRQRGWGQAGAYSEGVRQRTDDLFWEFARLAEGLRPRVIVAENVSGLVKGAAKGYFKLIIRRLAEAGFNVQARLLDASWLGVPQARQRLIFIGVRSDLGAEPAFPAPLPWRYTIADAGLGGIKTLHGARAGSRPGPAVMTGNRPHTHTELVALGGEPVTHDPETGQDITISRYAIGREWNRTRPGGGSARYLNLTRPAERLPLPTVTQEGGNVGAASVTHWAEPRKLTLGELRALSGFPPDFTLTGTYTQRWERIGRAVPPVMMAAVAATVRDRILAPLDAAA